jgi:hypothetical protein
VGLARTLPARLAVHVSFDLPDSRTLLLACACALATLAGCAAQPPAHWQRGGAQLVVPRARWVYGELAVELDAEGRVLINGEHELNVDSAGRVYDADNRPIALIETDGRVAGVDDVPLGWVGAYQAMRVGESDAWLVLTRTGELVRITDDGESRPFGVWLGCNQMPQRQRARSRSSPAIGVGVGVGVGFGMP